MSPYSEPGTTREKVFRYVERQLRNGVPPTVREVQTAMGFRAVQTAREHLEKLVKEGRLVKQSGKARGYRLPPHNPPRPEPTLIPLLGQVQAGGLHEAIENQEGYVPIQEGAPDEFFALRVRGESMSGVGILPGDIVVVRVQPTAQTGEVVVALVGDEATVKTLKVRGRRIELHPENEAFEPIIPPRDACQILGKVVEVRRYLEPGRV